jgi:hypothetical protein
LFLAYGFSLTTKLIVVVEGRSTSHTSPEDANMTNRPHQEVVFDEIEQAKE